MSGYEDMNLKELIEIGIKSEMDAQEAYGLIAEEDIPTPLENSLRSLKKDEKDHEESLRTIFKEHFPDKEPVIPDKMELSEEIKTEGDFIKEGVKPEVESIAKVIERAMNAEKDAQEYHKALEDKLEDRDMKSIAASMAYMEKGHYERLKHQLEGMKKYGSNYGASFKGPGF